MVLVTTLVTCTPNIKNYNIQ